MVQFFKRWFHHYTLDKATREISDSQKVQTGVDWDEAIASGFEYMAEQDRLSRENQIESFHSRHFE